MICVLKQQPVSNNIPVELFLFEEVLKIIKHIKPVFWLMKML